MSEATISPIAMAGSKGPPRKRLRTSQACDYCSKRSIRCQPSAEPEVPPRCQNCADFDVPCTYDRPIHKRGQKKRKTSTEPSNTSSSAKATTAPSVVDQAAFNGSILDTSEVVETRSLTRAWRAFAIASESLMKDLVEAYYDIAYAIFPWFHRATLLERMKKKEYLENRGLFASIMAMCALTCTRIRDGAPCPMWTSSEVPDYEHFYNAAKDAIPKDLSCATGIDFVRACGLLALTSMQNGQFTSMHCWVGMYHSLSALDGLWDENRWPKMIDAIEQEERRYLFWSFYTFEVFTSIVCGTIIRNREAQSQVRYPSHAQDPIINGVKPIDANSWLLGWNFVTDLYRVLEHAIDSYRKTRPQLKPELYMSEQPPPNSVMLKKVRDMYVALPAVLKTMPPTPMPGDLTGFQAANIQATLALVQLVIFASGKGVGSERKCEVAGELLGIFSHVPMAYLKTMGSPLLHQLAGIGSILASAIETPLSDASYGRARALLLDMAVLLESLESGMHQAVCLGADIRKQVQTMDEYLSSQSENRMNLPMPSFRFLHTQPLMGDSMPSSSHGLENVIWQFPQELLEWPWSNVSMESDNTFLPFLTFDNEYDDPSTKQNGHAQSTNILPSHPGQMDNPGQHQNAHAHLVQSSD